MSADTPLIVWLEHEQAGPTLLGGKFGSLAELVRADFAVPPGFGITTAGYRAFVGHEGLLERIGEAHAGARSDDLAAIESASAAIADLIAEAPLPDGLEQEIRDAYAELERRAGVERLPVAVRSSGILEDTEGASFAGQYDTYLWIQGADAVLEAVRRCWAGLFGPAVLTYDPGGKGDVGVERTAMCVGIQQMVPARAAGVAFTLDPVTGDRSKVVIEAVWGLGEGVVSGDVTPDRFRVDKITLEVLAREIAEKECEHRLDPDSGEVRLLPVEEARRGEPCLTDAEVVALAAEAKRVERHRGAPQDLEWAIDGDGRLHVLQVRPETVWSRREAKRIGTPGQSGLQRVLSSYVPKPTERSER
jgi:pyruvate, water dikinase